MDQVPVVKAFTNLGATEDGDTVVFTIQFADGTEKKVGMLAASISPAVVNLQAAAHLAEQQRRKLPPSHQKDRLSVPYTLRNASVGVAANGSLVLQIETRQGIPIAITLDQAQASHLAAELASPPDKDRPRMN